MSYIEPDALINAIKNNPAVWNPYLKEYRYKHIKVAAWRDIAKAVSSDWDNVKPSIKELRVRDVKKKWINMRDYYKKHLNRYGLEENSKRRKYIYFDRLSFLKNVYWKPGKRKTLNPTHDLDITYEDDESIDDEGMSLEIPVKEEATEYFQDEDIDYDDACSELSAPDKEEPTLNVRAHDLKEVVDPLIPQPPSSSQLDDEFSEDQEDRSDWNFLKSLLPDMKRMSEEKNIDFKIGIMKLLKSMKSQNRTK